jgi:hypothetical protein
VRSSFSFAHLRAWRESARLDVGSPTMLLYVGVERKRSHAGDIRAVKCGGHMVTSLTSHVSYSRCGSIVIASPNL